MNFKQAFIICLVADLGLLVLERVVKGPSFMTVRVLCIVASGMLFFAWTFKGYRDLSSSERALRTAERAARELEGRNRRDQEAAEAETRRLQRNARQRERRAERRALEEARVEQAHTTARMRAQPAKAKEPPPSVAVKAEPKSRWDRLLEDDED